MKYFSLPFFRLFSPLALLLIFGAWFFGTQTIERELTQIRSQDLSSIRLGSSALKNKIELLSHDLLFLSRHSALRDAVNYPSPDKLRHVAEDFAIFSESRGHYDQIRWIDQRGMEIVRVDYVQGKAKVSAHDKLQDKSQRYYFTNSIKLKFGEIFVSPLDLNIEQNKIEVPYKPIMRAAMQVADQKGNKRGIIILNYYGNDLLQSFSDATVNIADQVMLINSDGYWLYSPNQGDEWGFMFNRPELSLAARNPGAWMNISNSDKGQIELDDGTWTWETVYPLQAEQNTNVGVTDVFVSSTEALKHSAYAWKSVSHRSNDSLNAIRQTIWLKAAFITSLLLVLFGVGIRLLVHTWESLAAERLKFRTVADFTYNWETWRNPEGSLLYCSPSCKRMTGHTADEFFSNPQLLLEITHADDLPKVKAHFQLHNVANPLCELSFRIVLPNGEIRQIEHACQAVFDESGSYLGRRASNHDITDRAQAEAALRESEVRLKEAQSVAQIGNWELDFVEKKLSWSDEIFHLFEIDPENFQATYEAFLNVVHPEDRDAVNAAYSHSLETREPYDITHRLQMRDGRIKWVTEKCNSFFDEAGKPTRSIGTVQDITLRKQTEDTLAETNERMHSLLDSMAEGAYGADINGNCTFVNQSFLRILGYENTNEVIGKHIHELIHHSYPDGSQYPASECRMYNAYRLNQAVHVADEVFWKKNGNAIPVEYWSQPIMIDGAMHGAIATFIDITERKQTLADLAESEERFRQMFERHSAAMLLIDPVSDMIIDANPAAANFYGYPMSTLRGMSISRINTLPEDEIATQVQSAITSEHNYFVLKHRLANGEIRTVEVYSSPVNYKNHPLLFSIVHDITQRKLAEEQIRNFAFYDVLTQLPNRRLLNDRLDQVIAYAKRSNLCAALLFLDLDNFKPLNDTYGHEVGDLLLIEAARRISNCVREVDTVARLGGDEFVVILSELDISPSESAKQAGIIAEKIRATLSAPYLLAFKQDNSSERIVEHHCSSSIGVAIFNYPPHRDDVLKWADMAMYEAKNTGRNRVVVTQHSSKLNVVSH